MRMIKKNTRGAKAVRPVKGLVCDDREADLLAAAEALLTAKDSEMVTALEWRRLRRAIKATRKQAASKESQR